MKKKLIIFGAGKIAQAVSYYFERDSEYTIEAFVCDDAFVKVSEYCGKPLVPFSMMKDRYSPTGFSAFVAVGYQAMNRLRSDKVKELRMMGYSLASYRSGEAKGNYTMGENSIVMDYAVIQPCVTLGNNVFVWGGAMIGHHADIQDDCWLTGGCLVGGITRLGAGSFLGLGATVGNEVLIGERCMLGAGIVVCKNIPDGTVLIAPNTEPHRLNAEQFTRMSTCFRV